MRAGRDGEDCPVLAADFRADDVARVLAVCGHDAAASSLFICEGLLVYLDITVIRGLLLGLRSRGAPGSVLAASLAIHAEDADPAAVLARANAARRAAATEPWRTILPARAHLRLLAEGGWVAGRPADDAEFAAGAASRRSLLVTARPGPAAASQGSLAS